jgi:hypothetical protein
VEPFQGEVIEDQTTTEESRRGEKLKDPSEVKLTGLF